MERRALRYVVVDAFNGTAFRGNPAAVCLLEEGIDDDCMQSIAREFNTSATAFLIPVARRACSTPPRFLLRWFTRATEVALCGHATLAAAHFLFESGIAGSEVIEFDTKSGILITKKVQGVRKLNSTILTNGEGEKFSVELEFPMIGVIDCESSEIPSIPETLNGLSILEVKKTSIGEDIIVQLSSGKDLVDIRPKFDEIERCAGRSIIVTAPAPPGTGFDLYTRVFCPKLGHNEDPVTGSVHCALGPYWSKKLEKSSLIVYQASARGGILQLDLDEKNQIVRIRGEAITVMAGTLYA